MFSSTGCAVFLAVVGVMCSSFLGFMVFLFLAELVLFMNTSCLGISIMSSVSRELRGQANAVSIFFLHLLGDFPSPYFIGLFNELLGKQVSMLMLVLWLIWAFIFWGLSWNLAKTNQTKLSSNYLH